ncbi:unnamed protein product [Diamesa serratosioi]
MSSDSENSDYVVEEYIKPLVVRNTYDKQDLISDGEHDSNSDSEEEDEETEKNTETNGEGKVDEQCKIDVQDENTKTNSRYILYVTNLSSETTREKLMDLFFDCGKVKGIRVPKVRLGKFAFVEMADAEGFKVVLYTIYCQIAMANLLFTKWLDNKLKELGIDAKVYNSYITGILEETGDEEEKRETITDILGSLIEENVEELTNLMFAKWNEANPGTSQSNSQPKESIDIDKKLAELLDKQSKLHTIIPERVLTEEEKRIKQQILANYSQCSDKEEEDEEDEDSSDDDDPDMQKNTNKSDVQQLSKEKREQAKADSAAKKDKDKVDRAKQKQLREDKKSKRSEKAVKGERRR